MHADLLPTLVRRYAAGVWRHRWIALALAWLVCLAGWVGVSFIPDQYESSARLYVDADAVLTPLLRGLAVDSSAMSEVEMLQNTLLSRPNLEKVISSTDLSLRAPTSFDREKLIKELGTAIRIQSQTRTLFTVTYRDSNPKMAYDVVQTVINLFVESATGNNRSDMRNARDFLAQQIASYESKLREAEKRRADFRARYVDLLPGDSGPSRLEVAREQVQNLQGQLQDAQAKRQLLEQQLKITTPLLSPEAARGGNTALETAERHLEELRTRYTDKHPEVVAARNLVASLKVHGGSDPAPAAPGGSQASGSRAVPNPVYEQLRLRLLDTDAQIASLQRQIAVTTADRDRIEAAARAEPGIQAEYMNLDRDYTVLRKNYEELLARRESMRIAEAADTSADKVKLRIVDPPQVPRVPTGPKRHLLISGVLLAGLGAGGGIAFLLTQLDRTFYTVQDLRNLGLPIIGGISLVQGRARRRNAPALIGFSLGVLALMAFYGGWLLHPSGDWLRHPDPEWLRYPARILKLT